MYGDAYHIYLMFCQANPGTTMESWAKTKIQDLWNGHVFTHHLKHVEIVAKVDNIFKTYRAIAEPIRDGTGNLTWQQTDRTYSKDDYTDWVQLDVSRNSFLDCIEFCEEVTTNEKTRYDDEFGMRQLFPSCTPKDKHAYGCSDFACEALQLANIIPVDWEPSITTTQQIFNFTSKLQTRKPFITELPFLKAKINYG